MYAVPHLPLLARPHSATQDSLMMPWPMVTGTSNSHRRVPPKELERADVGWRVRLVSIDSMIVPRRCWPAIIRGHAESSGRATLGDWALSELVSGELLLMHAAGLGSRNFPTQSRIQR